MNSSYLCFLVVVMGMTYLVNISTAFSNVVFASPSTKTQNNVSSSRATVGRLNSSSWDYDDQNDPVKARERMKAKALKGALTMAEKGWWDESINQERNMNDYLDKKKFDRMRYDKAVAKGLRMVKKNNWWEESKRGRTSTTATRPARMSSGTASTKLNEVKQSRAKLAVPTSMSIRDRASASTTATRPARKSSGTASTKLNEVKQSRAKLAGKSTKTNEVSKARAKRAIPTSMNARGKSSKIGLLKKNAKTDAAEARLKMRQARLEYEQRVKKDPRLEELGQRNRGWWEDSKGRSHYVDY